MTRNKQHLQKYAMHFGTYMGLYWILKFIIFPIGLVVPFLLFLFICLTIAVPFLGYYYVRTYRDKICGGSIRFAHAWVFTLFMYVFASILTAAVHFLFLRFIDQGRTVGILEKMLQTDIAEMEPYKSSVQTLIDLMQTIPPIDMTIQLMSRNVVVGSILAIFTALIVMKRKRD
jgi:hypothetical protein